VPPLPFSIELHDSRLAAAVIDGCVARLQLRPAYIHRDGKGWRQDVDLEVSEPTLELNGAVLPAKLADGRIKSQAGPYHNLLELPLELAGPVLLTLELFSEAVIRVGGTGIRAVLHGEATYVEDFA
jgi:hypothetical protein